MQDKAFCGVQSSARQSILISKERNFHKALPLHFPSAPSPLSHHLSTLFLTIILSHPHSRSLPFLHHTFPITSPSTVLSHIIISHHSLFFFLLIHVSYLSLYFSSSLCTFPILSSPFTHLIVHFPSSPHPHHILLISFTSSSYIAHLLPILIIHFPSLPHPHHTFNNHSPIYPSSFRNYSLSIPYLIFPPLPVCFLNHLPKNPFPPNPIFPL